MLASYVLSQSKEDRDPTVSRKPFVKDRDEPSSLLFSP